MPKPRKSGSRTRKARRGGQPGTGNRAADFYIEQEVKRLLLEGQALTRPGHYDPQQAMRVRLELDRLMLNIQRAKRAADAEYFGWLEANIPEMFRNTGRPHWIQSEKVKEQDRALLKEFEETLARNVAANAGKKHKASQKTYSDLADKDGDSDEDTVKRRVMRARRRQDSDEDRVKRRVMRARRRQKALNETTGDILSIAALGQTDGDKVITPKEYKTRGEGLLEAFRRLRTK